MKPKGSVKRLNNFCWMKLCGQIPIQWSLSTQSAVAHQTIRDHIFTDCGIQLIFFFYIAFTSYFLVREQFCKQELYWNFQNEI